MSKALIRSGADLLKRERLQAEFFHRPTRVVARDLLGTTLARRLENGQVLRGIVVEVEAYLAQGDAASHSHRGPGKKNASMYLQPGTLYVYPIHARHCLNVVTEPPGKGAAVLIRALEPLEGQLHMARLRSLQPIEAVGHRERPSLTQGPARLCQALDVDRSLDGLDLTRSRQMWFEPACQAVTEKPWKIKASPRIGISQAQQMKLRWFIDGNRFVSGQSRDHSRGRTQSFVAEVD